MNELQVQSVAFSNNGHIPPRYTCEGENINPSLEVSNVPERTKTLALIMEDPDAPRGTFDHWVVWNILPNEAITERTNAGTSGVNSFGKTGYAGPCPPSGTHRYVFKIFAIDTMLDLQAGATKNELLQAMDGHVLSKGELLGHYQKRKEMAMK